MGRQAGKLVWMMNIGNRALMPTVVPDARHPRERGDPVHGFWVRTVPICLSTSSLHHSNILFPASLNAYFPSSGLPVLFGIRSLILKFVWN